MNPGQRNYEAVGGGAQLDSTRWEPQMKESNGFQMTNDGIREGYYAKVIDMPGSPQYDNKPYNLYLIHTLNPQDGSLGVVYGVIGDKILDERMATLQIGSFIFIKYCGKKHKKGTPPGTPFYKNNSYHTWEVGVDRNAIPYAQMVQKYGLPIKNDQPAQNNQGQTNQPMQNHQQGQSQNNGAGQNFQQGNMNQQGNNFQQGNNQQQGQSQNNGAGQNFQQGNMNQQGNNFQQGNNQQQNFTGNQGTNPFGKSDLPF
jgi:hypothetical protein